MSSEPQVTRSKATKNSTERVLTRRQADLLPVYDVVGRWLHREPAFCTSTSQSTISKSWR